MLVRLLAAAVVASLAAAAPAVGAGDPVMPLSQVQAGMRCTGYSVFHGTDIGSFDVTVLDVVAGDASANGGPQILIQVSGPAVDATGIGPGFSGSPIYCPDAAGVPRNIGAIADSVGEFGGKVALATPIESILGTPVDPPRRPTGATAAAAAAARPSAARERAWLARARPIATPLTVSGLTRPLSRALADAGRRAGRTVFAAPSGPLGAYPPVALRPGSAVGVGYSSGDLRLGAIGTVAYVDGDRVWAFGHPLDGVGARALLLEDAYVFHIINNPNTSEDETTYKLASTGHDLGTLSDDAADAVAGRIGTLPHTVPVQVLAQDADTGARRAVNVKVADEAAAGLPLGVSPLTPIAPLAVAQAVSSLLAATPARLTATMCARIGLRELERPLRFCNRYVSNALGLGDDGTLDNAVTSRAGADLMAALSDIDEYTGPPPHVTGVSVRLVVTRGARQAFLRRVQVSRRVRPGGTVRVRVTLQRVRGGELRRSYRVHIPAGVGHGRRTLALTGRDVDTSEDSLGESIVIGGGNDVGKAGPRSVRALAARIRGIARYDGVTLRLGGTRVHAFRARDMRISGGARTTVRLVKRPRSGRRHRAG
jgi:hypothetical protein